MYGARPLEDLAVTRFYTTRDIYEIMKRIHEFDTALREAFEKGEHANGVYFIRKDITGKLVPCSPNKLLLSSLETLRPFRRILPIGFQSGYKTHISSTVQEIDEEVNQWFKTNNDDTKPVLVGVEDVIKVVDLISKTLDLHDMYPLNWNTFKASIEHLSRHSKNKTNNGKVWVVVRKGSNLTRIRQDGRFSDDPDGGSGRTARSVAREVALDIPALILIKHNGTKDEGWRDTPFWWPILMTPKNTEVAVFAEETIT